MIKFGVSVLWFKIIEKSVSHRRRSGLVTSLADLAVFGNNALNSILGGVLCFSFTF